MKGFARHFKCGNSREDNNMRHRLGGIQNVYMGLGIDNIPYELDNSWSDNVKLNEQVREELKHKK